MGTGTGHCGVPLRLVSVIRGESRKINLQSRYEEEQSGASKVYS